MNPKDPLLLAGDATHKELFTRFSRQCDGFQTSAVIDAAANIIINAIRQAHSTRGSAEMAFDELFGRMKSLLVEHYDYLGRKRGVFAYDQNIELPRIDGRLKN